MARRLERMFIDVTDVYEDEYMWRYFRQDHALSVLKNSKFVATDGYFCDTFSYVNKNKRTINCSG